MRQKCVKNTPKWVLSYWGKEERSKMIPREHLLDDTDFSRIYVNDACFGLDMKDGNECHQIISQSS